MVVENLRHGQVVAATAVALRDLHLAPPGGLPAERWLTLYDADDAPVGDGVNSLTQRGNCLRFFCVRRPNKRMF